MNSKTSDQTLEGVKRDEGADGSLGQQLRRARQARDISLRTISDQTRITMRHLEAIESDEYKHLPGGIFNRSFIKAFARAVDFDERRALDLYARQLRERGDHSDDVATSPQRSRVYMDGDGGRPPALTLALSALLVGILCLGIYALYRGYERRYGGAAKSPDAPAQQQQQQQPAPGAPPQQSAQTSETTPAPERLQVELRAKDKSFWVTWRPDDERRQKGQILRPGEPEGVTVERSLLVRVGKADAPNLEVTINGQLARLPVDAAGSEIELVITKENYRQFLP
ncbi:MAG TPA: helix-turn-helix domain-containing protein [Pyrinomonadaceae bacterium]|nr:helix-turn-helix domain-containing protein [Pyrinomonadaceae bacterium]